MKTLPTMKHNALVEFFELQVAKGAFSKDDAQGIKDGSKQFQTEELFLRKQLTGTSGVLEFINENDVRKNCVTNLSKGYTPAEKNIIATALSLRFGFSSTNVAAELVDYSTAIFNIADTQADGGVSVVADFVAARRIPIQLQNAEYELKIEDKLIDGGRVADLLTQNVSSDATNGDDKNFKQFMWPKLILAAKKATLSIKFPENGTVPAGYYYAELVVKGLAVVNR